MRETTHPSTHRVPSWFFCSGRASLRASRSADFVCRERLVIRTGCPLIPPAGTFSPHGVEKDPIQTSARPADGSFPITPQRRQPRVPPLPRVDSAPNRARSPKGEGWGEGEGAARFSRPADAGAS
jgi:hypothetical protein